MLAYFPVSGYNSRLLFRFSIIFDPLFSVIGGTRFIVTRAIMGRLGFIFTARVLHRRPLSDVAKGDYDVDRGQASQRWYTWTLSKWLHMKVFECQFFLLAGDEIFSLQARDHIWITRDDVRKT